MTELLQVSPHDASVIDRTFTHPIGLVSSSTAANFGTNPLTGSAAKLFSILGQIKKSSHTQRADTLHLYLENELKRFAQQIQELGYQEEQVLLSQYILCYTFDQTIAASTLGQQQTWRHFSLMSTLPHAHAIEQSFKTALAKMCQLPEKFIDILELIYICLNLTGPNQQPATGQNFQSQENLAVIYNIIQNQRGEFEKRLSKPITKNTVTILKKPRNFFNPLFMFCSILIMIGSYFTFNYLTYETSQPIEKELNTLVQTTYSSQ